MMFDGLSPPVRRLFALAILAVLCWTAVTALVVPLVRTYAAAREEADRYRTAIERSRSAGDELSALRGELDRVRARSAGIAGFLRAGSEPLAAAELQNRLRAAADSAHAELKSVQVLLARDENRFRRVAARAQTIVTHTSLQKIIHDLESGLPYLLLDNVDIRARPVARGHEAEEPLLDVRFEVAGYYKGGE